MDENGESRVGFQEILKYCMKGGKMRGRNYFGLLIMVLFAFVAILAPTTANSEDAIGYGTDPFGNRWEVTSEAGQACSIEDNKGNPYAGIEFKYIAKSLDLDAGETSVIQANVDYTICEPMFTKTAPDNRKVKLRDCDPNSPFRCDDPTKDVVTFEVIDITTNSDTMYEFKFCAENASVKNATVQLKTPLGNVIVPGSTSQGAALGPGCCSNVQRITEATLSLPNFGYGWIFSPIYDPPSEGSVVLSFDVCSGDINSPPRDAVTPLEYESIPGGFFCLGDETSFDARTCSLIQTYGPEPFGSILATTTNLYVGFGSSSWRGPGVDSHPEIDPDVECSVEASGHSPTSLTYADDVQIELDWCGNLQGDTNGVFVWHCEANERGRRDDATCGIILSGNGVFSGSCYIWKYGRWLRYPDSFCR
jgi:hypothetical protein